MTTETGTMDAIRELMGKAVVGVVEIVVDEIGGNARLP